jgi:hypothetical protein
MSRMTVFSVLTSALIMFSGCHITGPETVKQGRSVYNMAIQQTGNEQLLLNIVRLRYRDTPYFLEVASVLTNFEFRTQASASAVLPEAGTNSYGFGGDLVYAEKPTITYTPLHGDKFVTQLLAPIDMKKVLLLYHSGWSIERIFRIVVQSINGVRNAPSASGPTPERVPEYEDFQKVADILRSLQKEGMIEIGHAMESDKAGTYLQLMIDKQVASREDVLELKRLLGLWQDQNEFMMIKGVGKGGADVITVQLRSLMASMFYVSQCVKVPFEHEKLGKVTVSRYPDGNRFDWSNVTADLININFSKKMPKNAYVAIPYKGVWFYIDDSDLTSKSTFSLLNQFFALQAGQIKTQGPVLTLPVDR